MYKMVIFLYKMMELLTDLCNMACSAANVSRCFKSLEYPYNRHIIVSNNEANIDFYNDVSL